MKITFLGAAKTVTGSKYLLNVDSKKILVDCGLFQGYKEFRLRNWDKLPIDPAKIDAVLVTHAHIDHTGYLPLLIKKGFKGKIYCTKGTKDLCSILLPDSGYLQEEDARRANRYGYSKHKPALPLYTAEDGKKALEQFVVVDFNTELRLFDALTVKFLHAGHIIGASMVYLKHEHTSMLFSGDLGRPHHPVMNAPAAMPEVDYLVLESTYGDRLHEKTDPLDELAAIVNDTAEKGGALLIPAFAVGRTQDLLYYLYQLLEQKRIPEIPIFLDSPMAQDVSDLLDDYSDEHRLTKQMSRNICQIASYTKSADESKAIDEYEGPVIIISASGMAEGGRILHHLKAFLPGERNTVLFIGYQGEGTRGERLLRGETSIKIHGGMVPVAAEIKMINGLSAHADYEEILGYLKNIKRPPKRVFITHGNATASKALQEKIENKFKWKCEVPDYMGTKELK